MADGASFRHDNILGEPVGEQPDGSRRSFALFDPTANVAAPPVPRRAPLWIVAPMLVGAVVAIALGESFWLRAALPLLLTTVAIVLLVRLRRHNEAAEPHAPRPSRIPSLRSSGRREQPDVRTMVIDGRALTLESTRKGVLARFDLGPLFGAVLLSSRRRDRLAAALTTRDGTFLVATRLDAEDRRRYADVLSRSSVLGADEDALDATGPDGHSVFLEPRVFREFVEALEALEAAAIGRIELSDQRGDPIRLDGDQLFVRHHRFDLSRPLEWRPVLFQEPFGQAITLYQGTWVRQGGAEVVFVSLLTPAYFDPAARELFPDPRGGPGTPELDLMAMRDQRLLQASATDPPATEHRVAMDGLFVIPLRAALDQAPRPSSQPSRARHA